MNGKCSQASCWHTAEMGSRRVYSILCTVPSHIPVFIPFVPFGPSLPSLRSPSPRQTGVLLQRGLRSKARSLGLESLPRHNAENRSGKKKVVSALSSGKRVLGLLGGGEERTGGMLSTTGGTAGGTVGLTHLQRSWVVAWTNKRREDEG